MFTGIIEEVGTVESIKRLKDGIRLSIRARRVARGLRKGASLAVDGCCLTLVGAARKSSATILTFDLLNETWNKTGFQFAQHGTLVNLERPLAANGRFDGHIVSGHVDGLGTIRIWEQRGADWLLEVDAPETVARYLIPKGSIAIDGISLTVAKVKQNSFQVWIIPHTYECTGLRGKRAGDSVNLEADLVGKYVERLFGGRRANSKS